MCINRGTRKDKAFNMSGQGDGLRLQIKRRGKKVETLRNTKGKKCEKMVRKRCQGQGEREKRSKY